MAKTKAYYKLLVKRVIKTEKDENGRLIHHCIWEEVPEVNLGSLKKPDKSIIEVRLDPIYSKDDIPDFMKLFKGG